MKKKKATDRHANKALALRFPEAVHTMLKRMADTEDRTQTAIMIRALKLYASQNGYPWPTEEGQTP